MRDLYRDARRQVGLSIEEAAYRLHVAPRTLVNYEHGDSVPPPEVALEMSRLYRVPWLTQIYCREHCAIGRAYSYEVLDRINRDPASVMLKLMSEMTEAEAVLHRMLELAVNKNSRSDFSDAEWVEFTRCLHEFLDVEHTVETLKIALGTFCDVSELIQQHNAKCWQRGYASRPA